MDRRQTSRRTCPGSIATVQFNSDVTTTAERVELVDASETGLRLIYHRELAPETSAHLVVRAYSGQWLRIRGSVVRSDPVPHAPGAWYIAVTFACRVPVNELIDPDGLDVVERVA